jgi:hypothetical protein
MINIYQIYFKEDQVPRLDYTPFYNSDCTVFFENSVIKQLIQEKKHHDSEYFGVVSYKLREKIGETLTHWKGNKNIANTSLNKFTPEQFEHELLKGKPDAMSFQRHLPHDSISYANKFHPGFSKYFAEILKRVGYHWSPMHLNNVFYCNYFVAKSTIYEKYINEMLTPAMEVMESMPELMNNSHYPHKLPKQLQEKFGISHYPFHPFLCERMFSYFAHIHNLKCLHY